MKFVSLKLKTDSWKKKIIEKRRPLLVYFGLGIIAVLFVNLTPWEVANIPEVQRLKQEAINSGYYTLNNISLDIKFVRGGTQSGLLGTYKSTNGFNLISINVEGFKSELDGWRVVSTLQHELLHAWSARNADWIGPDSMIFNANLGNSVLPPYRVAFSVSEIISFQKSVMDAAKAMDLKIAAGDREGVIRAYNVWDGYFNNAWKPLSNYMVNLFAGASQNLNAEIFSEEFLANNGSIQGVGFRLQVFNANKNFFGSTLTDTFAIAKVFADGRIDIVERVRIPGANFNVETADGLKSILDKVIVPRITLLSSVAYFQNISMHPAGIDNAGSVGPGPVNQRYSQFLLSHRAEIDNYNSNPATAVVVNESPQGEFEMASLSEDPVAVSAAIAASPDVSTDFGFDEGYYPDLSIDIFGGVYY